ncbi:MAG TPA: hypothetical protein VKT80_10785, partial [Chloroflexota bacterium]|nr:hypothetical protein [Chloroflexota bacterium]
MLIYVVLPIAGAGMRMGLNSVGLELVEDTRFKIFAAYCPTPISMLVAVLLAIGATGLWNIHNPRQAFTGIPALLNAIITGSIIGFSVSFFLLWIMFRLRFREAAIGWLATTFFGFLGSLLACFIMFLVVLPVSFVVSSMGYSLTPVASTTPSPIPEIKPPEPRGLPRPYDTSAFPTRQYQPAPVDTPPANTALVTAPLPRSPIAFAPTPSPAVASNPSSNARQSPPIPQPPQPSREPAFVAQFRQRKSPQIADVKAVDLGASVRSIVHTRAPSPFVAIVKDADNGVDTVEVWNVITR